MTKNLCCIICSLLILQSVYAQDIPSVSNGDIQFYVDRASFKGKEDKTIQEFYIMTFSDQFESNSDTLALNIKVELRDNRNRTAMNESWTTYAVIQQDSLTTVKSITDQFRKELDPGKYSAEFNITDPVTDNKGQTKFTFEIPDLSDEFTSTIKFITAGQTKSDELNPNPSRRYGVLNPVLSVYYEIYPGANESEKFLISYSVVNNKNEVIKKLPSASVNNKRMSMAVSHGFDVSNVASGIYTLSARINDLNGNTITTLSRPFEVIQFDYADLKTTITEQEAEESGRIIKILAPSKYPEYENLNLQGKAEYLVQFWRDLDPSPGTPENEYLKRILQRYHYANQNFTWGKEQGWESDRGRVLLQYGNPDEIAAHHAESETAPYEIWYYAKDRNYMFVFADMQSNGHFVLVHSTKEGEIKNSYWKNSLQK